MSISIILIVVFSIHLVVFANLYYRRKQSHHLLFVLVFLLLILSNAFRLWGAELRLHGYAAYEYLRVASWIATAVAILFWVKQKKLQK